MKLIIDGNSLMHRVCWVHQHKNSNVSPIYMFLTALKKYADKFNSTSIYVAWDDKLNSEYTTNYRYDLSTVVYKDNRDNNMRSEVHKQYLLVKDLLKMLNVKSIQPYNLEADDVIAWLARRDNTPSTIISTDKDLHQLVNDYIQVHSPIKDVTITMKNFEEHNNVPVEKFLDMKALIGDKSDNIPGLPRCGVKTAYKILSESDYPDNLTEDQRVILERNKQIMSLDAGFEHHPDETLHYERQLAESKENTLDINEFIESVECLGFGSIVRQKTNWNSTFARKHTVENAVQSVISKLKLNK